MLVNISKSLKQKGQGIVEYAILLAFVVGIAMMLQGVGLANAVKDTFDSVATLLRGENKYVTALKKWGHMTVDELMAIPNDQRLAADQQALINMGQALIGKSWDELQADFFNDKNKNATTVNNLQNWNKNDDLVILNFEPVNKNDGAGLLTLKNDSQGKNSINWMQGDYGTKGENGYTYSTQGFDNQTRYFFSDEMIKDKNDVDWGDEKWGNDRSVRVQFTMNQETQTVESVRLRVNRGTHNDANIKSHMHELDVTVTKDGGKQTNPGATGFY